MNGSAHRTYLLERRQVISCSRKEAFGFFADAFNLERITPPFLNFSILTKPPIRMQTGARIEYRLHLFGIPLLWRTRIDRWAPDESFVDRQIRGPYALWRHTHLFEEQGPNRTLMRDVVEYRIPGGFLGKLAHGLFVKRWLRAIFDYRAETTARLLGSEADGQDPGTTGKPGVTG